MSAQHAVATRNFKRIKYDTLVFSSILLISALISSDVSVLPIIFITFFSLISTMVPIKNSHYLWVIIILSIVTAIASCLLYPTVPFPLAVGVALICFGLLSNHVITISFLIFGCVCVLLQKASNHESVSFLFAAHCAFLIVFYGLYVHRLLEHEK